MSLTPGSDALRAEWTLDPEVAYLTHGSFGACPRRVLEKQAAFQARLEKNPMRLLAREVEGLLDAARSELAVFVGSKPENLVFVQNASAGVSTVLRSLRFEAGDELLCTSHGYNSCNNALDFVAQRAGAKVVIAPVPFPTSSLQEVLDTVVAAFTPRTRLLLIDHVTSPTGLVFPVEALVHSAQARGIQVLVDGAHAPGMLALDLEKLGADYYTGNCHKWMCTPKVGAFLHVQPRHQDRIVPLIIGHGYNAPRTDKSRFLLGFDIPPTQDPSPFLCIPEAMRFFQETVAGGWEGARAHNFALAKSARRMLIEALGAAPGCPEEMLGSLAAVVLPDTMTEPMDALRAHLFEKHRIEVPLFPWGPKKVLRISAQVYNQPRDYERLVKALT